MTCVECHRPIGVWVAPNSRGWEQGWRRQYEQGPHGLRCADRGACARAAEALQPSLFEVEP